jgi:hypothetical protein
MLSYLVNYINNEKKKEVRKIIDKAFGPNTNINIKNNL